MKARTGYERGRSLSDDGKNRFHAHRAQYLFEGETRGRIIHWLLSFLGVCIPEFINLPAFTANARVYHIYASCSRRDVLKGRVPCAPVPQSLSTTFDNVEMKRATSVAGSIIYMLDDRLL